MSTPLEDLLTRFQAMLSRWTPETTMDTMRQDLDAFYSGHPMAGGAVITRVTTPVPGEWVSVPEASESRALLLLHGGGFAMGSARAHRAYASHLSQACGVRVLTPDYRLAPEHPYPAAHEDAVAAYDGLIADGFDPLQIAVCGDSAGGGLALSLLLRLRAQGKPMPAAAVLVCPWADLACAGDSYVKNAAIDPMVSRDMALGLTQTYLGPSGDPRDPLASPLYGDLKGLPPVLIEVGEREIFLDDSRTLDKKIRVAGGEVTLHIWPGMIHQFPLHVGILPDSAKAVAEIGAFVRRSVV